MTRRPSKRIPTAPVLVARATILTELQPHHPKHAAHCAPAILSASRGHFTEAMETDIAGLSRRVQAPGLMLDGHLAVQRPAAQAASARPPL